LQVFPVTIIIPAFNASRYIYGTIESAIRSRPSRIIVVDDGSEDETSQIVSLLQKQFKIITLLAQENSGESSAINLGLRYNESEFVVILSADDLISERLLEVALDIFFEDPNCIVAYPSYEVIDHSGSRIKTVTQIDYSEETLIGELICLPGPGSVIRARSLGPGRNVSMRQIGDLDQWVRICSQGTFVHIPDVLASWRQHESNMSHKSFGSQMSLELDLLNVSVMNYLKNQDILNTNVLLPNYQFNWYRKKAIAEVRVPHSLKSIKLALISAKILLINKKVIRKNYWTTKEFIGSLFPFLSRKLLRVLHQIKENGVMHRDPSSE